MFSLASARPAFLYIFGVMTPMTWRKFECSSLEAKAQEPHALQGELATKSRDVHVMAAEDSAHLSHGKSCSGCCPWRCTLLYNCQINAYGCTSMCVPATSKFKLHPLEIWEWDLKLIRQPYPAHALALHFHARRVAQILYPYYYITRIRAKVLSRYPIPVRLFYR